MSASSVMPDFPLPIVADAYQRAFAQQVGKAVQGSSGNDFEFQVRHKDGRLIWVAASWQPIYDAQGACIGYRSSIRDISERKQAEEEAYNAASQWQATFDAVQDVVLLLDKDFRVLRANRAAAEFLGLPLDKIVGGHCYDFMHGANTPPAECPLARMCKSRSHEDVEIQIRKGGPWSVSVDPLLDARGDIAQVVHVGRDITKRKRAEDALRQSEAYLAEAQRLSHTGSWAFDVVGNKYIYASDECLRIFELDRQETLPNREMVARLIHPEDWDRANADFERTIRDKVDVESEFRIRLPGGTEKHVQASRHPVLNDAGDVVEVVGTVLDITERKLAEDELRRRREHLEDLVKQRTVQLAEATARAEANSREKSRFLANMSHELRTPLNAVLGFSRLLMTGSDVTPRQQEALDIIARSGEHLLNLINNVLDIAKIESGTMVLKESGVDLHGLAHEMQSLMAVKAAEKGLCFALEYAPDLPRFVMVDAGKLRQVLLHLLDNAIKYTNSGKVNLRTRLTSADASARTQLRFEVEDTGPGIGQEDCQRMFLPFVQVSGRDPAAKGTGLGLAICKQYVELMGGQIGVASEIGKGSVFYFTVSVRVLPSIAAPEQLYTP